MFRMDPDMLRAFRGLILPHVQDVKGWIPHGIGKLAKNITLGDSAADALRIHVWAPWLACIGPAQGAIHNHNHDFKSLVVAGEVDDQEFHVEEGSGWTLWEHRTAEGTVPVKDVHVRPGKTQRHRAGQIYRASADRFHHSSPVDVAVTLLWRWPADTPSYAVARAVHHVVDGLTRHASAKDIERALGAADVLLRD